MRTDCDCTPEWHDSHVAHQPYRPPSDLLAELQADRFGWTARSDADECTLTLWRGSKDGCEPDTVMPVHFYGLTLDAAIRKAYSILASPTERRKP